MDCKEAQNRLLQYIEKTLPESEEKSINLHIENCENCSRLFNEMEKTYGIIESDKSFGTYPHFTENVLSKIDKLEKSGAREISEQDNFSYVFGRIAITGIAAVIILVIGIYVFEGTLPFNYFVEPDYLYPDNVTNYLLSNL
jgi:predicted anti-sigma-YlaC factor YlaD